MPVVFILAVWVPFRREQLLSEACLATVKSTQREVLIYKFRGYSGQLFSKEGIKKMFGEV